MQSSIPQLQLGNCGGICQGSDKQNCLNPFSIGILETKHGADPLETHLIIWEQFDYVGPEKVDSVLRAVITTDYLLDAREYGRFNSYFQG